MKSFNAFVAKQIDQENRYFLFVVDDTNIEFGSNMLTMMLEVGKF